MNFVIIESGSTKADWIFWLNGCEFRNSTLGINPTTGAGLDQLLSKDIRSMISQCSAIFFYGAGAGQPASKLLLQSFFDVVGKEVTLEVCSDMLAASRACMVEKPAIICILGTGSNSCIFDGQNIVETIPSLGYLLSDEGSGNHIGKEVLKSFFYKEMGNGDEKLFIENFEGDIQTVLVNLYQKQRVSAYLGDFSKFLNNCSVHLRKKLLNKVFNEFVEIRIKKYVNFINFDIYFIGSIAEHYKLELEACLQLHNLTIKKIIVKPIDQLLEYHKSRITNE